MRHEDITRRSRVAEKSSELHVRLLATLGILLLSVAAGAQAPAVIKNTEGMTATVTAIEPETRLVTLRNEDGEELVVEAGEKVRNFEQIEVGDRVDVLFYEALAAELTDAPPTARTGGEPVVIESRRAPPGEKPAGAASMMYTAVVTVDSVDPEENTVEFTGPGGQSREVVVEHPEMQEFIRSLSPGDRVQVTYGEALAVAVRPAE
ncbi:MAG TPA: hypothetical protein VKZ85_15815 [Woeseiaceae bacterium]|nr:hypothetical protein [Woeseiaceae bacterium]